MCYTFASCFVVPSIDQANSQIWPIWYSVPFYHFPVHGILTQKASICQDITCAGMLRGTHIWTAYVDVRAQCQGSQDLCWAAEHYVCEIMSSEQGMWMCAPAGQLI